MTSQVFYRKWRPQRFADVVGQEHITRTLLNALSSGRVAHAYLFCGPRGTGKTSTGRILAKAINCLEGGKGDPCNECAICTGVTEGRALDLIEIDAASNRGIDEIRSLREKVNFAPNEARFKVYIIDEVHMLTKEAFNALLKTLEEPPPHAVFILATTEADRLPATVISRCQRFDFRRISLTGVVERLAHVCSEEGVDASTEALTTVARAAGGSLRDAENLLEQLVVGRNERLEDDAVRELLGLGGDEQVRALAAAALTGDVTGGLSTLNDVAVAGLDLAQFHRGLMEFLRGVMLAKAGAADSVDVAQEERTEMQRLAGQASMDRIVRALRSFGQADLRAAGHSSLPLELALVDSAEDAREAEPAPSREPQARSQPVAASTQPKPPPAAPRVPAATPPAGSPAQAGPPPAPPAQTQAPPEEATLEPPKPVEAKAAPPTSREAPPDRTQKEEVGEDAPRQAPPEPVAPVLATDGANGDLFLRLQENWRAVIEASRGKGQKFKLDALLRSGRLVGLEGEAVVVGFTHQIFIDRMREELDNPGTRKGMEEALESVLGIRLQVSCVMMPKDGQAAGGHLLKAAEDLGARIVKGGEPERE
jgi:DNA polymerase-3 subunit gamma/tau